MLLKKSNADARSLSGNIAPGESGDVSTTSSYVHIKQVLRITIQFAPQLNRVTCQVVVCHRLHVETIKKNDQRLRWRRTLIPIEYPFIEEYAPAVTTYSDNTRNIQIQICYVQWILIWA